MRCDFGRCDVLRCCVVLLCDAMCWQDAVRYEGLSVLWADMLHLFELENRHCLCQSYHILSHLLLFSYFRLGAFYVHGARLSQWPGLSTLTWNSHLYGPMCLLGHIYAYSNSDMCSAVSHGSVSFRCSHTKLTSLYLFGRSIAPFL